MSIVLLCISCTIILALCHVFAPSRFNYYATGFAAIITIIEMVAWAEGWLL